MNSHYIEKWSSVKVNFILRVVHVLVIKVFTCNLWYVTVRVCKSKSETYFFFILLTSSFLLR